MRPTRTPSEESALHALIAALRNDGALVEEVPGVTDKPDAALVLNGEVVAVECRRFMLQDLMRHYSPSRSTEGTRIAYFPLEPHAWVYKSIQKKNEKIPEYCANAGSKRAWLLLHSEPGALVELPDLYLHGHEQQFKLGAVTREHGFERVYLWGPTIAEPICLFSELDSIVARDRLRRNPPNTLIIRKLMLQTLDQSDSHSESATYTGKLSHSSKTALLLQPLDIRFKVNYSPDPSTEDSWVPNTEFLGGRLRFREARS